MNPVAWQTLTVSTSAVGLTMPTTGDTRPRGAYITVTGADVRWRGDSAPTSTVGQPVTNGSVLEWFSPIDPSIGPDYYGLLTKVKFIRDTAATSDATLYIQYFD